MLVIYAVKIIEYGSDALLDCGESCCLHFHSRVGVILLKDWCLNTIISIGSLYFILLQTSCKVKTSTSLPTLVGVFIEMSYKLQVFSIIVVTCVNVSRNEFEIIYIPMYEY